MKLLDKYLPAYHFRNRHNLAMKHAGSDVFERLLHQKIDHWLIRLLFRMRGLRSTGGSIMDLEKSGFVCLERSADNEIIFGIISRSPTFGDCVEQFAPAAFLSFSPAEYIKGVISFSLANENGRQILSTETRIFCTNPRLRNKFRIYWFFVGPFSSLIRKLALKQLVKDVRMCR
jgi:hypothetical protein